MILRVLIDPTGKDIWVEHLVSEDFMIAAAYNDSKVPSCFMEMIIFEMTVSTMDVQYCEKSIEYGNAPEMIERGVPTATALHVGLIPDS